MHYHVTVCYIALVYTDERSIVKCVSVCPSARTSPELHDQYLFTDSSVEYIHTGYVFVARSSCGGVATHFRFHKRLHVIAKYTRRKSQNSVLKDS